MTTAATRTLSVLDAALVYRGAFGWSVVPTHAVTKRPIVEAWKPLQEEPACADTIRSWFTRYPYAGVGIITGAVSDLWVVDVDSDEGHAALAGLHLPQTARVKTGKGQHLYFRRPGPLRNTARRLPGLDTRGDGGYVVAPPSTHASGAMYCWITPPWDMPPADAPAALVSLLSQPVSAPDSGVVVGHEGDPYARLLEEGAPAGQRHDAMTRLVGRYIAHGLGRREVAVLLRPWVDRCRPAFPYQELYTVIRDVWDAEQRKRAERSAPLLSQPVSAMAPGADDADDVWGASTVDDPAPARHVGSWRRRISARRTDGIGTGEDPWR